MTVTERLCSVKISRWFPLEEGIESSGYLMNGLNTKRKLRIPITDLFLLFLYLSPASVKNEQILTLKRSLAASIKWFALRYLHMVKNQF